MKIYLAGSRTKESDEYMKKYGANRLFSFLNEEKDIKDWHNYSKLMVDSGAHSWNKSTINRVATYQTIKVENLPPIEGYAKEYIRFIKEFRNEEIKFVELDTYGVLRKEIIDDMYKEVMDFSGGGICFIRVYHPVIDGSSLEELFKWIDDGQTYIGLGNDSTHLFDKIFFGIKNRVKLHGFAMTKMSLLDRFPFYSVDSTSWQAGARYGKIFEDGTSRILSGLKKHSPGQIFLNMLDSKCPSYASCFMRNKFDEHNIKASVEYERYITKLWKERGIIWDD